MNQLGGNQNSMQTLAKTMKQKTQYRITQAPGAQTRAQEEAILDLENQV